MATTQTAGRADEIRLEYGVPQVVAFKFLQAKAFDGTYGTRALFTLSDDRRMWLDAEDGSEIERSLRELGVQRGELVRLTKVKFGRGGGHCVRVERVAESCVAPDASGNDDTAAQLEKSIAIARAQGPQAFQRNAHVLPADASRDHSVAERMMGCFKAAIDAAVEIQAYAGRKGLGLTFSEESVRAIGLSIFIQHEKAMTEVRR